MKSDEFQTKHVEDVPEQDVSPAKEYSTAEERKLRRKFDMCLLAPLALM
jgi:hypothetical protein